MYYKATLCLSSFRQFLYWHKRSGGGGWNEAFFCCYALYWLGSLAVERSGTGNVPMALVA
jgi:hypothetical protein